MSDFLPDARDRFALSIGVDRLQPGRRVRTAGHPATILGVITCVDPTEAWLELQLEHPDGKDQWLALETTGTGYRCTLWRRRSSEQPPTFPPGALEGTARFKTVGRFPGYEIPHSGLMTYREHPGPPAIAAERFATGAGWLIGKGDGQEISLELVTK